MNMNRISVVGQALKGVVFLVVVVLFAWVGGLYAGQALNVEGCGDPHQCVKCHQFNPGKFRIDESKIVSKRIVGGLWEVVYDENGSRGVFYLSIKGDYIFSGQVVDSAGRNLTRRAMLDNARRVDVSQIPMDAAVLKIGGGSKKIVVFDDLECPFCARLHFELKKFILDGKNKDYSVYVMLYPLPGHGKAREKSEYVSCLKGNAEKVKAVDDIYAGLLEGKLLDVSRAECSEFSSIDKAVKYGNEVLKIKGTPVLILPDGRVIDGYIDSATLGDLLNSGGSVGGKR